MGVHRMLGVNYDLEREKHDFYATHPSAIKTALPTLRRLGLQESVWECACGEGHISKVLMKEGFDVKSSDAFDRGFGEVIDFLKCEDRFFGDIITNPPFRLSQEFIEKAMELLPKGGRCFFFLKIQFVEGRKRRELFKRFPPKFVAVYSERQKCAKGGKFSEFKATSGTQCYAWFVFEKGFKGKTELLWI